MRSPFLILILALSGSPVRATSCRDLLNEVRRWKIRRISEAEIRRRIEDSLKSLVQTFVSSQGAVAPFDDFFSNALLDVNRSSVLEAMARQIAKSQDISIDRAKYLKRVAPEEKFIAFQRELSDRINGFVKGFKSRGLTDQDVEQLLELTRFLISERLTSKLPETRG